MLRLVDLVARAGDELERPVGVCGDAASDPLLAPSDPLLAPSAAQARARVFEQARDYGARRQLNRSRLTASTARGR